VDSRPGFPRTRDRKVFKEEVDHLEVVIRKKRKIMSNEQIQGEFEGWIQDQGNLKGGFKTRFS
jgi:hypothetical protein